MKKVILTLLLLFAVQVQAATYYVDKTSGSDLTTGTSGFNVLGSELATNGDFNSDTTGWSAGTGSIAWQGAGTVRMTVGGATTGSIIQSESFAEGTRYILTVDVTTVSTSGINLYNYSSGETFLFTTNTEVGSYSHIFTATSMDDIEIRILQAENDYVEIDNISVKEITDGPWEFAPSMSSASGVSDGTTLSAGDFVLFKGGETWTETITVGSSGSAGSPITYSNYGIGPIFDGESTNANCITTNSKNYITIKNIRLTGSTGVNCLLSGNNNIIENCIIDSGDAVNVQITGSSAILNNNSINGAGTDGIDVDESCTIQNNIVFGSVGDDITIAAGKTVTGNNNCIEDAAAAGAGTYTDSKTLFNSDPLFVDASGNDFHLERRSPCFNAGADVGVDFDFDKRRRSGRPEIGAYEIINIRRSRYLGGKRVNRTRYGN